MESEVFTLDLNFLPSVGLGDLTDDDANGLLAATYEELEFRVGFALADLLTEAELDEFMAAIDSDDEDFALAVLERLVPNYKDFVTKELDRLTSELRNRARSIRRSLGLPELVESQSGATQP